MNLGAHSQEQTSGVTFPDLPLRTNVPALHDKSGASYENNAYKNIKKPNIATNAIYNQGLV